MNLIWLVAPGVSTLALLGMIIICGGSLLVFLRNYQRYSLPNLRRLKDKPEISPIFSFPGRRKV
jgi:hypothetical protein